MDVGDRTLTGFRPPLFDNPATVGFFDDLSGGCFSSDCFGAPLPTADLAQAVDVRDVAVDDLRNAQLLWATVDSPWVRTVDMDKYLATFQPLKDRKPDLVLSTHLPPAAGIRFPPRHPHHGPGRPALHGPGPGGTGTDAGGVRAGERRTRFLRGRVRRSRLDAGSIRTAFGQALGVGWKPRNRSESSRVEDGGHRIGGGVRDEHAESPS